MLRRFFSRIFPHHTSSPADATALEPVYHRNGVVTFRLPATWVEEADGDDGMMAYYDEEDIEQGRLRLQIVGASSGVSSLPATSMDYLAARPRSDGQRLTKTSHGDALRFLQTREVIENEPLYFFVWELAHFASRDVLCVAIFTWTSRAAPSTDLKTKQLIEMLDREISEAFFAPNLALADDKTTD